MIQPEKLDQLLERHGVLETEMASGPDPETYVKLASEHSELVPVVDKIRQFKAAESAFAGAEELLSDAETDAEMRELAELEREESKTRMAEIEDELKLLLLPRDAADDKSAILEIRAGTGGSEAALFGGDLFRMYERHAASKGWKVEVLSESAGDVGGYKEIIASITGRGVFARKPFLFQAHCVVQAVDQVFRAESSNGNPYWFKSVANAAITASTEYHACQQSRQAILPTLYHRPYFPVQAVTPIRAS